MGGTKKYIADGGFTEQTYKAVGETNGIKEIKIIKGNNNTPLFSNTPNTQYSLRGEKGDIIQVAVYGGKDGRKKIKDIDTGHPHTNKNGKKFSEHEIHVQEYNTSGRRSAIARKPSKKERRLLMLARNKRR